MPYGFEPKKFKLTALGEKDLWVKILDPSLLSPKDMRIIVDIGDLQTQKETLDRGDGNEAESMKVTASILEKIAEAMDSLLLDAKIVDARGSLLPRPTEEDWDPSRVPIQVAMFVVDKINEEQEVSPNSDTASERQ